ncbi:serine hydrolase-domain-containing protein [Corynascus novoguineensis]|uniref:Serine hydrolase-domain-containing protein n=1 Tax=Corynascus novoguineensis TaxID=1126955 RepID=A0AAN7CTM1_9PEZI|nr:serine hydrolase-domain-containing protein [Corynascus novoguineensis]
MSGFSSKTASGFGTPSLTPPLEAALKTPATGSSSANSGTSTPGNLKKVRLLMLHGYTQSGAIFRGKVNGLIKKLNKLFPPLGLEPVLIFPTAPNKLTVDDVVGWERRQPPIPGFEPDTWAWYRSDELQDKYLYLEEGMNRIAETLQQAREDARREGDEDGGVDGVIGFSQGGCMAGMLASALEAVHKPRAAAERTHERWLETVREANGGRPLKFAVIYGGFRAAPLELEWLYNPKIATPTMHWIGSVDTVVGEERSMGLVKKCIDPVVLNHPGGHFVPIDPKYANALVSFIHKHVQDKTKKDEQEADDAASDEDTAIESVFDLPRRGTQSV